MHDFVVSGQNAPCPNGSEIINNKTECFRGYYLLKTKMNWTCTDTSCEMEGTWGHVAQCGVHLSFDTSGSGGNYKVHFKSNLVDGNSPNEGWVRICKKIPRIFISFCALVYFP